MRAADGLGQCQSQGMRHAEDDEHQRGEDAQRLDRVGPDERADAAATGVEPDEQNECRHGEGKRHMTGIEDKALENHADDIELHRRPRHLADEKEEGATEIAALAQPALQIGVDARQPALVIHRHEHKGHGKVSQDISHAHLQIGHLHAEHHAGHGDKRHARDAGPDHAEGNHRPRRTVTRAEEVTVVGLATGQPRQGEQAKEIHEYGKDDDHGCKRRKKKRSSQKQKTYLVFINL